MKKIKFFSYTLAVLLAVVIVTETAKKLPDFIRDMTVNVSFSQNEEYKAAETAGTKPESAGSDKDMVLVNAKHPYTSQPEELVRIYDYKSSSYFVKDKNVYIEKRVMTPLNRMMDEFYRQTGLKTVNVISAYRSVDAQQSIYERSIINRGLIYTKKYVQKPNYSEHHTGLAVDLAIFHSEDGSSDDFTGEGAYAWFKENAWRFGFILRYEKDKEDITGIKCEPWHFRYVGEKNAAYIYKNGLCLEQAVS